MQAVTMKDLLSAGVHFGHQTSKWNPKMKQYIFGARNGIYIVDLQKTVKLLQKAMTFVRDEVANGKEILFVGTKTQAKDVVREEAQRAGANYIVHRWLGGLLTNYNTVKIGMERWEEIEKMKTTGVFGLLSKKEVSKLEKERAKLEETFIGIRGMKKLPGIIFVVDSVYEEIAIKEAKKLGISVVALVDTNGDPDYVDYIIPGNDDAIKSVKLFASLISDAVVEGKAMYQEKLKSEGIQEVDENMKVVEEKVSKTEDEDSNVIIEKIRTRIEEEN